MTEPDDVKGWVAEVFDRAAPTYDRIGDSYHDSFGARLVEVADIKPGAMVLDVACGRGAVLLPAAARVGAAGRVVGIDISPQMVEAANVAAREAHATNAEARVMDAEHLDIEDATFDTIVCSFGVFFLPEPERAAREFHRVLRPSGVVALSSWTGEDRRWSWQDELLADIEVPRRAITRPFDEPEHLAQLLADAHFADIDLHLERRTIWFATPQQWWDWLWSFSIRGVLEQMDDTTREEFQRAAFTRMTELREDGGFPMELTACFAVGHKLD